MAANLLDKNRLDRLCRSAGADDVAFVERLLRLGIVCVPGSFLGAGGEGFVRFALVPTPAQSREAIARMAALEA